MDLNTISRRMRRDWNRRARTDPAYYVALSRHSQSPQISLDGAEELVGDLQKEFGRISSATACEMRRALEIGCGPGRLMVPLHRFFREIHGVDVSEEMVHLARQNLARVAHAHVHASQGTDLAQFPNDSFDFIYSFAVFQHIPCKEVVFNYLREIQRVLKTGGVARLQFNGLPESGGRYDTWCGVRFTSHEIAACVRTCRLQLLALEGAGTQYMWATLIKPPADWPHMPRAVPLTIQRVANADFSGESVAARGRFAGFALWVEGLGPQTDMNALRIYVGGRECRLTCISPPQQDGLQQVTALLGPGVDEGLQRIRLVCDDPPAECESFLRVVSPGPMAPSVVAVTDAVFPGVGRTILSGRVRVHLEESVLPGQLQATLDGRRLRRLSIACTVPEIPRFEIDFKLPTRSSPGKKPLEILLGERSLGAYEITIRPDWRWWRRVLHPAEFWQAVLRVMPPTPARRAKSDSGTRPDLSSDPQDKRNPL